jgi:hypothetical protein
MALRRSFWSTKARLSSLPSFEGVDQVKNILVEVEHACHHSPVLEAAFTSSFIEGQTQEYQLEDTNPKIFRLLVQWFYNQKFKHRISKALDSTEVDKDGLTTLDHIYLNLAQLYIVAERLIILKLKGDISLSITMMAGDTWSTAWMKVAFEATTDNSALRQIAVKMCVDQVPSEWVLEHRNDFSYDLLIEVLAGMKSDQKHQYTPPSAQKFVWDERSVLPANSKEEYLTCRLLE